MTRSTGALQRLGVPALTTALVGGVLAALPAGVAAANHTTVTSVVLDAPAGAAVGTCVPVTVTVRGGNTANPLAATVPAENTRIDVVLSENNPGTTATPQDVDFCTAATGGTTPQAGQAGTDTGAAGTEDRAEFVTGEDGTVTFGVLVSEAGTVNLQAFVDQNNDNARNATEAQGTDAITFFGAGAAGSDQRAGLVNCVDATPDADTNPVGETHVLTVRLTANNAGNLTQAGTSNVPDSGSNPCTGSTIAGVTPSAAFTTTQTAPSAITCTQSDNNGVSQCTYTGTQVGTDAIQVYVNQLEGQTGAFEPNTGNGQGAGGSNRGEPGDRVAKTYVAAQPARSVDVICLDDATSSLNGRTSDEDCVNVITDANRTFRAVVDSTNNTSSNGTLIAFALSGGSGDETITLAAPNGTASTTGTTSSTGTTPFACTTTAYGTTTATTTDSACDIVVNDPTPRIGEQLTVTVTVRGTTVSDAGTLTYRNRPVDARFIAVTPDEGSTVPGGVRIFTATVTDALGNPVPGVSVVFTEEGAGFIRETRAITNAAGQATAEVTSGTAETGAQTVTGTIAGQQSTGTGSNTAPSQCGQGAGQGSLPQGGAVPSNTRAGTCSDTGKHEFRNDVAVGRITLAATSSRVTAGNAPELFGLVTLSDGTPARSRTVTLLQKRYNTTAYEEVQTTAPIVTDEQGAFRVKVRPLQQTAYVARVAGTTVQSDAANSGGRPVIISVHNRINLASPTAGTTVAGRALQVRGDLDPDFASVPIGVGVLRNGRFSYVTQGVTDASGAFVIDVRNLPTGSYALVVYTSARQGTLAGSASRAINVS